MHIVASLKPNNKLQIKRYRLADGYGRPPSSDDDSHTRNSAHIGRYATKAERLAKYMRTSSHIQHIPHLRPEGDESDWVWEGKPRLCRWQETTAEACYLADTIVVPVLRDGKHTGRVEHLDYYEVARRRLVTLDLLKKSQHEVAKPRPWGLPTKPKEFRWQAGEKILEGGAIIDRFVGVKNASMLTLTLPGSTWYAMDALARWSGWIVNRLTQVIRRTKSPHCDAPYWFFVWEHQKRGALHMHWCIAWDTLPQKRLALCYKLKDLWFNLLEEISVKEGIDLFKRGGYGRTHRYNKKVWQWDIQQVERSVAAYFAKYCEKNVEHGYRPNGRGDKPNLGEKTKARKRSTHPSRTYPSRYWGSSQTIKRWSKRLTQRIQWAVDSDEFANTLVNRIRDAFPTWTEFSSVSRVPFQVIEPTTGICIASGITESYFITPRLYPAFHSHMCNEVFERPYRMDAMDHQFLDSGGSCKIGVSLKQ